MCVFVENYEIWLTNVILVLREILIPEGKFSIQLLKSLKVKYFLRQRNINIEGAFVWGNFYFFDLIHTFYIQSYV